MGKLALAAKITHVPSMYLSELDGPRKGTRQDAIDGHWRSAGAAARSAWTPSWCSTRTGWSTPITTSTARRNSRACYTSNELPHFISNMAYEFPGNPALGQLLAKACNEHRRGDAGARRAPRWARNTARWCRCAT